MSALDKPFRPVDRWFEAYAADHQHPANQSLHVFCVPAIVWSILALLYVIPTPQFWRDPLPSEGVFAVVAAAMALSGSVVYCSRLYRSGSPRRSPARSGRCHYFGSRSPFS
jgi:uncharacterized membrane protein YGL010W